MPCLRFNPEKLSQEALEEALSVFRRKGYVVIEDVFERDSVDQFLAEAKHRIDTDRGAGRTPLDDSQISIFPTKAPRVRQVIAPALDFSASTLSASVTNERSPALFEVTWIVQNPGKQVGANDGWHKDRDIEGMPGPQYSYPKEIHIGMYLEDMTPELGPTQVIPGSHQISDLSPYDGGPVEAFMLRKQDVVLWDQRLWHRATKRTIPGQRVFAIFGFYAAPAIAQRRMSQAQREAWENAENGRERVLYGGVFGPV